MTKKKIITFTTKEYKPQGNTMSPVGGPVSISIEETDFPTKEGDKKVKRICFFPSSSISEKDIKKVLQIENGKVKKLTFEIEVDGSEIEAKETPKNFASASHSASRSASAESFSASWDFKPEPKNSWENEVLSLNKFKLSNIKVKTSAGEQGQQQNQGNQGSEQTKPETETNPTGNTSNSSQENDNDNQTPPLNNQPTQEEINDNREKLNDASRSNDSKKLSDSIEENEKLKDKGVQQSSEDKAAEEAARKKLANDKEKYRQTITKTIKAKLEANDVKKDELSPEAKTNLEKLEGEETIEPSQVDAAEKVIVEDTYKKAAEKKLTDLTNRINRVIKSKDREKMKKLQSELSQLTKNSNYQSKKSEFETLAKKLETALNQNNTSNDGGGFPLKIVVPIALAAIAVLAGAIILVRKRKLKSS